MTTTSTVAKWAERVREWRASEKTADEFARPLQFEASTLRYWASRLKIDGADTTAPALARVVRTRRRAPSSDSSPKSEVEIAVAGARIVVRHGFDAALLREVVAALGSAR